jgi:hypothetical protein
MAIDDLSDRLNRRELRRVTLPGGKEAYTGPGATQALKAMDAEAMTVDRSIIVAEDFNPTDAYDASLYAHEAFHAEHGRDGPLGHVIHDAEETAARAVEQMVFHRMAGGYDAGYTPSGGAGKAESDSDTPDADGRGQGTFNRGANEKPDAVDSDPDAIRGYWLMRKQGMSHMDVVEKIARDVVSAMDDAKHGGNDRQIHLKGAFSQK